MSKHPGVEVYLHICQPMETNPTLFVRETYEKLHRTLGYKVHECQHGLSKSLFHRLAIDLFAFKT